MSTKILSVAVVASLLLVAAPALAGPGCCGTCSGGEVAAPAPPACGAGGVKACGATGVAAIGVAGPKACAAGCTKPCCAAGVTGAKGKKACPAKAACCGTCGGAKAKPATAAKPAAGGPHLAAALAALDKAHKAVEAGDRKAALAAIADARRLLRHHHARPAAKVAVNATCPMTGRPVNAAYLRTHGETTIGFCGPGCAARWDKGCGATRKAILAKAAKLNKAPGK